MRLYSAHPYSDSGGDSSRSVSPFSVRARARSPIVNSGGSVGGCLSPMSALTHTGMRSPDVRGGRSRRATRTRRCTHSCRSHTVDQLLTPAYTAHAYVNISRSAYSSDEQSTSSASSLNVLPHDTDVYASNEAVNWTDGAWFDIRGQVRENQQLQRLTSSAGVVLEVE
jgi:hypothetical protein